MTTGEPPPHLLSVSRSRLLSILLVLLLGVLLLLPLVSLFLWDSEGPRDGISGAICSVWGQRATWRLMGRSLFISSLVTFLATVSGAVEALLYFRSRFRGRGILFFLSLFPLFVQPVLIAIGLVRLSEGAGFISVGGNVGTVVVLWIGLRPLVTLCVGASLRSIPAEMEENALLDAGPVRVALRLSLRLAAPGVLIGALLVFLRAMLDSAVPAVFGAKAYAFETFAMLAAFYDDASALAFATPILAVGIIVGTAVGVGVNRLAVRGVSFVRSPVLFPSSLGRTCAVVLSMLWIFPFWLLTGWGVLNPARLISSLAEMWPNVRDEIARTAIDSACAAMIVSVVAFMVAAAACYGTRVLKGLLKFVFTLPLFIPPVLLGVAMVAFWNQPDWRGELVSTPVVLVLGKALLLLPILAWPMLAIFATLERDLIETLALYGGGWRAFVRYLLFPAVRPHLPLLGLIAFLLASGEFEISTLLSPPGWTPFSVRLFTLLHYGVDDVVAGLSLIGFIGTLVFALAATWLARARFLPE